MNKYFSIFLNPDFAIGVRTETSEAESFSTQKVKAMHGHRLNFLRKKKSGIVRRIPRPIANSGLTAFFTVLMFLFMAIDVAAVEIPLDSSVVNAGAAVSAGGGSSKGIAYIDIELIFNEHPMTARLKGEFEAQAEKAKKDVADMRNSLKNINSIIISSTTEINSLKNEIAQVKKAIKEKDQTKTVILPGTTNVMTIAPALSTSTVGADPAIIGDDEKAIKEKEAGIETLKGEYSAKLKEIEKKVRSNKDELTKLEDTNTQTVLKDIYKVLGTIASEDNLTIVLDKNNVLYGQASQDITNKVRDRMRGR